MVILHRCINQRCLLSSIKNCLRLHWKRKIFFFKHQFIIYECNRDSLFEYCQSSKGRKKKREKDTFYWWLCLDCWVILYKTVSWNSLHFSLFHFSSDVSSGLTFISGPKTLWLFMPTREEKNLLFKATGNIGKIYTSKRRNSSQFVSMHAFVKLVSKSD